MCQALSKAVLNCGSLWKGERDAGWGGCISPRPPTVAAVGCLQGGQETCRGTSRHSPPTLALVTSQHCRQWRERHAGMENAPNKSHFSISLAA